MNNPEWLPDWFDLKNYDSVANMDLSGWAQALQIREIITSAARAKNKNNIEEIIKHLVHAAKHPDAGWDKKGLQIPESWLHSLGMCAVSPVSVGMIGIAWSEVPSEGDWGDYKHYFESGEPKINPEIMEKYERLDETPLEEIYFAKLPEGKSYLEYTGGLTFAFVDITASDERLIEEFKSWLKEARARAKMVEPKPHKFTSADLMKWHEKQVLPYIDLTNWAQLKDIKITQQEIGNVLFPNDYDISLDDRIRRTVKPLVEELQLSNTICAISMQADFPYY